MKIAALVGRDIGEHITMRLSDGCWQVLWVHNDDEESGSWYKSPLDWRCADLDRTEVEFLKAWQPDLIIVAFHHKILKEEIFSIPRFGTWNFHLGDCSKYKGAYPQVRALMNGDKTYTVTCHQIDAGVDTGPILAKKTFDIPEGCTGKELYHLMHKAGGQLFDEVFDDLLSGKALEKVEPQLTQGETMKKKDLSLEVEVSEEAKRKIKALTFEPFDPPFIMIDGAKYEVRKWKKKS